MAKHTTKLRKPDVVLWPNGQALPGGWDFVPFRSLATLRKRREAVVPDYKYRVLGMRWYAKGAYVKDELLGAQIKSPHLFRVSVGDFLYNRLFAWKGSFGVIENDCGDGYVSGEFPCFETQEITDAYYLWMLFAQPWVWAILEAQSAGTTSTSRLRLKEDQLADFLIPLPPAPQRLPMVQSLRDKLGVVAAARRAVQDQVAAIDSLSLALLRRAFNGVP